MASALSAKVRSLLRCPTCKGELLDDKAQLRCVNPGCQLEFPTPNGVPVLIDESRSVFLHDDVLGPGPRAFDGSQNPSWRRRLSERLPDLDSHPWSGEHLQRMSGLLSESAREPVVLVVGGAILGNGMDEIARHPLIELIESDIYLGPRVQLLFDAHDIPFPDESFDGVIAQGVLEHVLDPYRCAAEITRVTKTGGLVYAETPFMQQVHGGQHDFTRFTRLGHRRLFRRFHEIESGISIGPGSVLAWSWKYLLASFCNSPRSRSLAHLVARLTAFPWKWLDPLLVKNKGSFGAASEYFFLGRKASNGWYLSDRELLQSYRGIPEG